MFCASSKCAYNLVNMLYGLLNSAAVCPNLFSIYLHSFPIIVLRVSTWTTRSFADNSAAICLQTYMPQKTFQLAISPLQLIGSGGGYYYAAMCRFLNYNHHFAC